MTGKLKQSIAVQRQIPEHIRNNYPIFVEFIKLYYEYLEETQAQDLEGIRDVDTTLEEFIDKFKSEFSENMPIDMAQDKRFLIKHLKEFYLSRGSESSFKFLFRTLFSKEAEIFYPSTEILRVSDGRWKQDVSVFVEVSGITSTLFPIIGAFITITTPRKSITTFVENVTRYSNSVFEVFIQRDYVNEIEIGSSISVVIDSVDYTGIILPCPSKLSIFKAGSGFKVGALYSLKTSLGQGCVIKVTKIGSIGEIKAIQVVSFGLDYKTKFYSYLSNKDIAAYEYIHPARLNHPYNSADPSYTERSGGYIEYGYASMQTYFYYDETIPVGNTSFASDRFYADATYVGEIVEQFYVDESKQVIDETLAIIEISLGAVAKYPGYYMTANGFISDEMYIHDGAYYQAFSYVVKVEEELRKYSHILKSLIHPAGMRVYAEYNIFKELKLSFVQPSISRVLQFANNLIQSDSGYGYSAYSATWDGTTNDIVIDDVTYNIPIIEYTPTINATTVYSNQGKAALFATKFVINAITEFDEITNKFVDKLILDTVSNLDDQSKFVEKPLIDLLPAQTDVGYGYDSYIVSLDNGILISTPNGNKIYSIDGMCAQFAHKSILDDILNVDPSVNSTAKALADLLDSPDSNANAVAKLHVELLAAQTDLIYEKVVEKLLIELLSAQTETYRNALEKLQIELLSAQTDSSNSDIVKSIVELLAAQTDLIYEKVVEKLLIELLSVQTDANSNNVTKPLVELLTTQTDSSNSSIIKTLTELLSVQTDANSNNVTKPLVELLTAQTDSSNSSIIKTLIELLDQPDTLSNTVTKPLVDLLSAPDVLSNGVIKPLADLLDAQTDFIVWSRAIVLEELLAAHTDSSNSSIIKTLIELLDQPDTLSNNVTKPLVDLLDQLDILSNGVIKPLVDILDAQTDSSNSSIIKTLTDLLSAQTDSSNSSIIKTLTDLLDQPDALSNNVTKRLTDLLDQPDALSNNVTKPLTDLLDIQTDSSNSSTIKTLVELLSAQTDSSNGSTIKTLVDLLSAQTDSSNSDAIKTLIELLAAQTDSSNSSIIKTLTDLLDQLDILSNSIVKPLGDLLSAQTDALSNDFNKSLPADYINTSTTGRLTISPYDSEFYFDASSDFQPTTIIS